MLVVRLAGESHVELPGATEGHLDGDAFLCCDGDGCVIARVDRMSVLAYGTHPALKEPVAGTASADGDMLFRRYAAARERYLNLEAEHHNTLNEISLGRVKRLESIARLEGLRSELTRQHDSEYEPARLQIVEDIMGSIEKRGD
jgi:hypothetical protein